MFNFQYHTITRVEYAVWWNDMSFTVKMANNGGKRVWIADEDSECFGSTRDEAAKKFVIKHNHFVH